MKRRAVTLIVRKVRFPVVSFEIRRHGAGKADDLFLANDSRGDGNGDEVGYVGEPGRSPYHSLRQVMSYSACYTRKSRLGKKGVVRVEIDREVVFFVGIKNEEGMPGVNALL